MWDVILLFLFSLSSSKSIFKLYLDTTDLNIFTFVAETFPMLSTLNRNLFVICEPKPIVMIVFAKVQIRFRKQIDAIIILIEHKTHSSGNRLLDR